MTETLEKTLKRLFRIGNKRARNLGEKINASKEPHIEPLVEKAGFYIGLARAAEIIAKRERINLEEENKK